MSGALAPRLVLVTRETEYEGLLARHATRGQADAFLRRRSQSLEGLDAQREHVTALLAEIRAAVPKGWRIAAVRRAELDRFLFGPEDVVVAVGQDGLVANVAKYLSGQPVIGVNADPARNAGVLVPHTAAAAAAMLPAAAAGTLRTERRTMIRAELDDGQVLLALNEVFVGHASHQSARYSLSHGGRQEAQSSSGLIVASGTGATGWALSIGRATGVTVDLRPDEPAAMFLVREPWPSRATGTGLVSGRLEGEDSLLIVSRMNEGGVVFADGMEGDRLDFAWGRTLRVSVARQHLHFVPGGNPLPEPQRSVPTRRPSPASGRSPERRETRRNTPPTSPAGPAGAVRPAQRVRSAASPRRRRWGRIAVALLILALLPYACALLISPPSDTPAALAPWPAAQPDPAGKIRQ
ncbi:NAD(+)/NADH kinase [Roseomonas indoligenes]|uniref:NAD(+)/NADH kinase n=1 Tax=Roseomonas indoligenes TaxID=2820811 RepID=A0A940N2S7_9PROT|nr:NAD(+)/NADH kinase [Pararoseomonas indoligenes]MBP0494971.1 NAD(+)/NADH kinase [Pararoseomonas indoligenes]